MLFFKENSYTSPLTIHEIIKELNRITEKYHTNSSNQYKFEGNISENEFYLLPTFDYNANNQIRPEIIGSLQIVNNKTEIRLKFQLPDTIKTILALVLFMNIGIILFMIIFPAPSGFLLWDKWWLLLIGLILGYFITYRVFLSKIEQSEKTLKTILEMVKS